jgi:RNA polymerase sigma factor (sigma-70 family)
MRNLPRRQDGQSPARREQGGPFACPTAAKNFVGFSRPAAIYFKTMTSDLELLQDYARNKSEESFAALVNRHLNLVYSAALRQVRSPQLAEEIAQSAFTDLARNAVPLCGMKPDTLLTAWLYHVTRRTAVDTVRKESRRQLREQIAVEMTNMNATTSDWPQIEPLLDDAMAMLDDTDRAAVLLRYFENKSLREIGQTLGTSDDAAQKRVSRAVERLREFFTKRGVTIGASGLAVVISANAVQAAPAGLAATISAAATFAGTTITGAATATAIKTIAMTTLQKTIITVTIAAAVSVEIYEVKQNLKLRGENESLQRQSAHLKTDNESLSNQLTMAADAKLLPGKQFNELLRLRGEVGGLRRQTNQLGNMLAQTRSVPPRSPNPIAEQQQTSPLPEDYPQTADGAAKGIFETWGRGNWDAFSTNFDLDGGRDLWDKAFTDEMKSNLMGLEVVSIGQPTNSFASNMWFVPYTIRFKDGNEKTFRLHLAQDTSTKRWILKGGF